MSAGVIVEMLIGGGWWALRWFLRRDSAQSVDVGLCGISRRWKIFQPTRVVENDWWTEQDMLDHCEHRVGVTFKLWEP